MDFIIPLKDYDLPCDKFISKELLKIFLKEKDFKKWMIKYDVELRKNARKYKSFYKRYLGNVSVKMLPMVVGIISYVFLKDKIGLIMKKYKKLVKLTDNKRIPSDLQKQGIMISVGSGLNTIEPLLINDEIAGYYKWMWDQGTDGILFEKNLLNQKLVSMREKEIENDKIEKKDAKIVNKMKKNAVKNKKIIIDMVSKLEDIKTSKEKNEITKKIEESKKQIIEYNMFSFKKNAGYNNKSYHRLLFKARRNNKYVYIKIALANPIVKNIKDMKTIMNQTGKFIDPEILGEYVCECFFYNTIRKYADKINMVKHIKSQFIEHNPSKKIKFVIEGVDITKYVLPELDKLQNGKFWNNPRVFTILVTESNPALVDLRSHITTINKNKKLTTNLQKLLIKNGLEFINKMKKWKIAHWDWHPGNIMIDENTHDFYLFDLDRSQLNSKDIKILPAYSVRYFLNQEDFYNENLFNKLFKIGVAHDVNRFLIENNRFLYSGLDNKMPIMKKMFGFDGKTFVYETVKYYENDIRNRMKKVPLKQIANSKWDALYHTSKDIILPIMEHNKYLLGGKKKKIKKKTGKLKKRKITKRGIKKNQTCKEFLSTKIGYNIKEKKLGKWKSNKQAVAVSYSQVMKEKPGCKRIFKRKKN